MVAAYRDFDLLVLAAQGRYQVRVINSPVGQAAVEFDPPFSADELQRFSWLTGRSLHGLRLVQPTPPAGEPLDPQRFSARLFAAAFAGDGAASPPNAVAGHSGDSVESAGLALRSIWACSRLTVGSFLLLCGRTKSRNDQGCLSVCWYRNLMALNATVQLLREACFSLRR